MKEKIEPHKFQLNKEDLKKLYLDNKMSSLKIAKQLGFSKRTILFWLSRYRIKRRKFSDYHKIDSQKIINLYLKGKGIVRLAKELKIAPMRISNLLRQNNIKIRDRKGLPPPNKLKLPKEEVIYLYINKKVPSQKIAKKYNTKHTVICNRLREWGVDVRDSREELKKANERKRKIKVKYYPKIVKLYKSGLSSTQICKKFNVSDSRISYILKKYGIKLRCSIYGYNDGLITKKGHRVWSSGEKIIADWLYKFNIDYSYNGRLLNSLYKYDFFLKKFGVYIEYFGMYGINYYDKSTKKKLDFYKKNNLNLIPIYPQDKITKVLDNNLLNNKLF